MDARDAVRRPLAGGVSNPASSAARRLNEMDRVMVSCRLHLILFAGFLAAVARGADYQPSADLGSRTIKTLLDDWIDSARNDRKVPVKVYYPEGQDPCPLVLFSHGLGGTREGYEFLGRYWASHGYISVHLQHAGSDDTVWKDAAPRDRLAAMRKAVTDPQAAMQRPLDVAFTINTLERLSKDVKSPLAGRLDLDKIAMAGHSFGAWTTLAVGGQAFITRTGRDISAADKRIKCMIPMSAPPGKDPAQYAASYGKIAIPALHMTGTLDTSPITNTKASERRIPFDHTPAPGTSGNDQYLITFEGGDHMIFSGARRPGIGGGGDPRKDAAFHKLIRISSLAFLDAYLKQNADARAWLQSDNGFKRALASDGVFEMKTGK
jgi:predicted dienelactone hydrolase